MMISYKRWTEVEEVKILLSLGHSFNDVSVPRIGISNIFLSAASVELR